MNNIIIILMIFIIVLLCFLIYKVLNMNNVNSRIKTLETKTDRQNELSISLDTKMNRVDETLNEIKKESDQSSMNISHIFNQVNEMNNIMVNKKTRGNFGEYQLNNLLSIYCGDSPYIYDTQYKLNNGSIGDVALHIPGKEEVMIIDSKFPLENYKGMVHPASKSELDHYQSLFKYDIKKHINDIAKKYITRETTSHAVMFIPSDAIYYYICESCSELIEVAYSKHVLMTSPTTLLGVVFTFIDMTKDINRTKNMEKLEEEIISMYEDAKRLNDRIETLQSDFKKMDKDFNNISISASKIVRHIEKIQEGKGA